MGLRSEKERRAFGRRRAQIIGVAVAPRMPPEHCIVRNISRTGALLDFGRLVKLPMQFELRLEGYNVSIDCEVRHQLSKGAGVLFLSPLETLPNAA